MFKMRHESRVFVAFVYLFCLICHMRQAALLFPALAASTCTKAQLEEVFSEDLSLATALESAVFGSWKSWQVNSGACHVYCQEWSDVIQGGYETHDSAQIIATSHNLTWKGSFVEGKSPYFRKIQVGEML